jgi:hypothetical protein
MIRNNDILLNKGKIIADSSSIIYLEKIDMLETYSDFKNILIPEPIYNELITRNGTTDYSLYLKIIRSIKAPIQDIDNSIVLKYPDITLIDYYNRLNSDGILTDDGKVCKYCKYNNIPYINAPMVILSLKLCNIIDLDLFYEKLDEVYKIGRYSKYVRNYLDNIIKEQIINV